MIAPGQTDPPERPVLELYSDDTGLVPTIRFDETTGLPLLSQETEILKLVMNYLPLPYTVAEHGCGQKASVILRMLALHHRVPPHAMRRGLVLEGDMSPEMLETDDLSRRPHALTVSNPLARRVDSDDEVFLSFIGATEPDLEIGDEVVHAGDYDLQLGDRVQFVRARSHVFVILGFWDQESSRAVERVVDPALDRSSLFPVPEIREKLDGPESWIFTAPLMGRFRLDPNHLTERQREAVCSRIGSAARLEELPPERHDALVRHLDGAREGTIGDPATWSSVNNIFVVEDDGLREGLLRSTGPGEEARALTRRLIESATDGDGERARRTRRELRDLAERIDLRRHLQEEAERCERELAPLATAANVFSYFRSLRALADAVGNGGDLFAVLGDPEQLETFHGIGVRLRRRIEHAARKSRDDRGRIDARALNDRYFDVVEETIGQMNRAGLDVCIDRVGNVHGLRLDPAKSRALEEGRIGWSDVARETLCFVSHVDTVADAGKYDGRLGVFSGIEMIHLLDDLEQYFSIHHRDGSAGFPIMVTAFSGEEMTFTGHGVSLPGSAAVSGFASVDDVLATTDGDGEIYRDRLGRMWSHLREKVRQGEILIREPGIEIECASFFDAAPDPTEFWSRHTYERHIEQGLVLHRRGVPIAVAETIVGIRHEDFLISGDRAEAAAWDLVRRLRSRWRSDAPPDLKVTCGILRDISESPASLERRETFSVRLEEFRILGDRDHAGTTELRDRCDAGVACGRLVRKYLDRVGPEEIEGEAAVSGSLLLPGKNRNVIPDEARVVFAIPEDGEGASVSRLIEELEHHAEEVLRPPVSEGGEGVRWERNPVDETERPAGKVRAGFDFRAAEAAVIESFLEGAEGAISSVAREFGVEVARETHQSSAPVSLRRAGVVLVLERSYGGSHNPRETETAADVLRGSVFQFALAWEFLERRSRGETVDLFRLAAERIPENWRSAEPTVSGGLHDTCNLARRAQREP